MNILKTIVDFFSINRTYPVSKISSIMTINGVQVNLSLVEKIHRKKYVNSQIVLEEELYNTPLNKQNMPVLYTKKQLAHERSLGLKLSDYENEHFYDNVVEGKVCHWSQEQFEVWVDSKPWTEQNKAMHKAKFKGTIIFHEGGDFSYE